MSKQPEFLMAQCSDNVYLTVSLPDARAISAECKLEGVFKFSAVDVNNESCNFILQLYGNISPQGCKTKIGSRNIMCCIPKEQKGWWKRLLKFEVKAAPHIKIDWNEEDENFECEFMLQDEDDVETDDDDDIKSIRPSFIAERMKIDDWVLIRTRKC